jgi:adenylate cyclase
MQLFSRHVSSGVANLIWKNRDQFLINGRLRPLHLMATVFFSDIKGFTSISEKLEPDVLMEWLNEYMKGMSDIVMENGGTIDKYIGDAIMAVFGFPIIPYNTDEIKKDAINAVNCAIAMEKELARFNKIWFEKGLPQIKSRIGIYTGKVLAGSLGSEKRLEYTVIGDTVNIASRMESFPDNENIVNIEEKTCRILIGEATYKLIDTNFIIKEIGEALLKGKKKSVKVYQVLD